MSVNEGYSLEWEVMILPCLPILVDYKLLMHKKQEYKQRPNSFHCQ